MSELLDPLPPGSGWLWPFFRPVSSPYLEGRWELTGFGPIVALDKVTAWFLFFCGFHEGIKCNLPAPPTLWGGGAKVGVMADWFAQISKSMLSK